MGEILDSFKAVISDDIGSAIKATRALMPKADAAMAHFGLWEEHAAKNQSTSDTAHALANTALNAASFVPVVGAAKFGATAAKVAAKSAAKSLPTVGKDVVHLYKAQKKVSKTREFYKAGKASGAPGWEGKRLTFTRPNEAYGRVPWQRETQFGPRITEGAARVEARKAYKLAKAGRRHAVSELVRDSKTGIRAGVKYAKTLPRQARKALKYTAPGVAGQGIDYATDAEKQAVTQKSKKKLKKFRNL